MPNFPIVDTHLHVWDPARFSYPWLAPIPILNKAYLLEDYDKACGPVPGGKDGLCAGRGRFHPVP